MKTYFFYLGDSERRLSGNLEKLFSREQSVRDVLTTQRGRSKFFVFELLFNSCIQLDRRRRDNLAL